MPLDVIFIGAYSLTTFGGGVKWFINLLNLLQIDGRIRPHLFVQDNVDHERAKRHDIKKMVNFDYQEIRHSSGQLLPQNFPSTGIDTVYTMTDRPQILQKAKELGASRVIFGAHDPYLLLLKGKKRRLFEEEWRHVTAIHILSPAQVAFSRYNSNLFPLPNTWFGRRIPRPKKFSKFTVLFFSRHEEDKGFDIVERVARTLPEDIDLYIVGSGTTSTRITRVRTSSVHVLGFIRETELYSILERSHGVLFPSRRESGLSMVAVEALAHHTPL
ncbi:MAG: glycosyltransferase, partial [Candidatus Bathyarchaeia archaeon]